MIYEARHPRDVGPFDDIRAMAPDGSVVVAVPELPDAIANLAAVFAMASCEVFDTPSHDA